MRRPTALTLAACVAAGLALAAHPGVAAADPAAAPVNLVANPGFEEPEPLSSWACDSSVDADRKYGGSAFVQVGPRGDEEPAPPPSGGGGGAAVSMAADDDVLPGIHRPFNPTKLLGTPTSDQRAECGQTIPVRPRSTYTLSAAVSGGMVFLGSDYGVTWTGGSERTTKLTTTFTTAAGVDSVRIYVHGWYDGDAYKADNVVLTGPDSESRVPAAPSALHVEPYTSRALALSWNGSPGATGYRVYRDGALIKTVTGTWVPIYGLSAGHRYEFTVEAVNSAGASVRPAPLVTESAPAFSSPPEAIGEVTSEQWGSGTALLEWSAPNTATDGHFVYVDGALAGWVLGNRGLLEDLAAGMHTMEVTSLNSAGESAKSPPITVTVE